MMAKRPLRLKLVRNILAILLLVFSFVCVIVYSSMNTLTKSFLNVSTSNAQKANEALNSFLNESTKRIENEFLLSMKGKAERMVKKDANTLLLPFKDNSFLQVRNFIQRSFIDDPEMIHATFLTVESDEIKAWQYVDRNYPKGLDIPIEYIQSKKHWSGRYLGKKNVFVNDEDILSLIKKSALHSGLKKIKNEKGEDHQVYEVFYPVVEGIQSDKHLKKIVSTAIRNGEPVGFLHYTLSLDKMNAAIKNERSSMQSYLARLDDQNNSALQLATVMGKDLLQNSLMILGLSALILLTGSLIYVSFFSKKITMPIIDLIGVAEKISNGNYRVNVNVQSDDEVGILATTFTSMCKAILKRDEELENLNKGLEDLVKQRTQQLHNEMKKVRNLLDSMRQAVFSINEDGTIVAPVSKFSDQIFNQSVEGHNVFDVVYAGISEKSELMSKTQTALNVVFGESDIQWMLMEGNLPGRIETGNEQTKRVFKINYNPIWDESGNLEQLMFVVDDITEVEKLEKQVEKEKHESAERMEILQEIAKSTTEDLERFILSAYKLFYQIASQIKSTESFIKHRSDIFRHLHTIKGNSKVYGLNLLGTSIHHTETDISELRDENNLTMTNKNFILFTQSFNQSLDLFHKYVSYSENILKIKNTYKYDQFFKVHDHLISHKESEIDSSFILDQLTLFSTPTSVSNEKHELYFDSINLVIKQILNFKFLSKFNKDFDKLFIALNTIGGHSIRENYFPKLGFNSIGTSSDQIQNRLLISCFIVELHQSFFNHNLQEILESPQILKNLTQNKANEGILKEIENVLKALYSEGGIIDDWNSDILKYCKLVENENVQTIIESINNKVFISKSFNLFLKTGLEFFSDNLYSFTLFNYELFRSYIFINDSDVQANYPSKNIYEYNLTHFHSYISSKLTPTDPELKNNIINHYQSLFNVPLRKSFGLFFKILDELAPKLGKRIQLKFAGDEIYLSTDIQEVFQNCMTHLLRNAIDHGIESPEERTKRNKTEIATIVIDTKDDENFYTVKIADNGRGIDPAQIKEKLIKMGNYSHEQITTLKNSEIIDQIFRSEFSTSDTVTDVSGRGVGLSVVKESLKTVGGSISVETTKGKGSTFILQIPHSNAQS